MLGELQKYYANNFPTELFYEWLSYGSKTYFLNREFSFTLHNDVYIRFLNFKDSNQLKLALQTQSPIKIDIGAVYNDQPKNKKMQKLIAKEKELVFDLDLSDYDEVRTCCIGATCCNICWEYIRIALKVIKTGLENDFGLRNLLFVYSGRRGVHIWVCDKRARLLSDHVRSAVMNYFSVVQGGADMVKKVRLGRKIHPSISRSANIIKKVFFKVLDDQKTFENEDQIQRILLLREESLRESIKDAIRIQGSLEQKWNALVDGLEPHQKMEIMLQYTYPRLDVNVSTKMNHLLKAPFCVHPKTGRICLPIWDIDSFDPTHCLTVDKANESPELLKKQLILFQTFVSNLADQKHEREKRVKMTMNNEDVDMTY
eukprot:NODE_299_length_11430_cov_0.261054.p4 type:complete len:371 gc:universal NODE_299_length_11430_cov_0.261054:9647-10759(+)